MRNEDIDPNLVDLIAKTDAVPRLLQILPKKYPAADEAAIHAWDWSGFALQQRGRIHEALAIHWLHYQHLLRNQEGAARVHKGTPLVRISDCFSALQFPVHAKRYLMLTLCEDAIKGGGFVSPDLGVYFRLTWSGVTEEQLTDYANRFYELSEKHAEEAFFPEALLQRLEDNNWQTEFPSDREALFYRINPTYVGHLLGSLGDGPGDALEMLAQYLMSSMPGCRTRRRVRSKSSDYDLVCAMERFDLDFRSELGRHFVCECKDWNRKADFTVMAKFCRVLDATNSRFGVLFSSEGISGEGKEKDAEREQLKVFQSRGIIIVVLNREDLTKVRDGANLIALLRAQYERVRLDLHPRTVY
jgi:hypothetical protein